MTFNQLIITVYRSLEDQHDISVTKPFLLAISGGVDSMIMLNIFIALRDQCGIAFQVVHINHQLRPAESNQEQIAVVDFCKKHDVAVSVRIWRHNGIENMTHNVESQAREFRYQNFGHIMRTEHIKQLVTAHHLNDQAETVLMRLVHGGRIDSTVGIRMVSPLYTWPEAVVIRPFLSVEKGDLYAIAEMEKILYFEDESNRDLHYTRNRMRQQYIPMLEEENANTVQHFGDFAQDSQAVLTFAKHYLQQVLPDIFEERLRDWKINLAVLSYYESNQQLVLLQEMLVRTEVSSFAKFSRKGTKDLLGFLMGDTAQGEWALPDNYRVVKVYQTAYIMLDDEKNVNYSQEWVLQQNQWQSIGERDQLQIGFFDKEQPINNLKQIESIVLSKKLMKQQLMIRHRQAGDYILLKDGHQQKLRRYFINEKTPQKEREQALLLVTQEQQVLAIWSVDTQDSVLFNEESLFEIGKDIIIYYTFN